MSDLYREGDPGTSRQAANRLDRGIARGQVYAMAQQLTDFTALEMEGHLPHLTGQRVRCETKWLADKGFLVYTGEKRKNRSGYCARVLAYVPRGDS